MKKLIIAVCLLLLPVMANAAYIGTFKFKLDAYTDTWTWRVDQVGDAYQVTGGDYVYPAAMNGGGYILANHLLLTVTEAVPGNAIGIEGHFAIHCIDLNLATMTGTDDMKWYTELGVPAVTYMNLTFQQVVKDGDVKGQECSGK